MAIAKRCGLTQSSMNAAYTIQLPMKANPSMACDYQWPHRLFQSLIFTSFPFKTLPGTQAIPCNPWVRLALHIMYYSTSILQD
jgi:hypothetical protein